MSHWTKCTPRCSQAPQQRRVIPYTPQYVNPRRPRRRVMVPAWLQASEPTRNRPLGVELPSGAYLAWGSSIPLGETEQQAVYETDTSDEDEYYDAPTVQQKRPTPKYRFVRADLPKSEPRLYHPRRYAVPIVLDSPSEDEEEEAAAPPASCCRTPTDIQKGLVQRMREKLRGNYY